MTTCSKQGKYTYFCGQCGETCEAETCQPQIQKDQNILDKLHHQNNELIEHIKFLSKRNDELNHVIQSRLRTEESSIQKQKARAKSNSGIIYRRTNYEGRGYKEQRTLQIKPQPVRIVSTVSVPKETVKEAKDSSKIIKTSHLPIDKPQEQRQSRIQVTPPKKRTVFAFEQSSSQNHSRLKVNEKKYEQYYDRTADKTPTKQLNYLPIYEYKKQQYKQPKEASKYTYTQASNQGMLRGNYNPNPPKNYEVTFRRDIDQNTRVCNYDGGYRVGKVEKRTNEPYLAMLDQSQVYPSVYYPTLPQHGLNIYYDRICQEGYPIQDRHRRLISEY